MQVSKAEYSRICGVERGTITKQCAKQLKNALVGDRIDMSHKDALKYLYEKNPSKIKELGLSYHFDKESQEKKLLYSKKSETQELTKLSDIIKPLLADAEVASYKKPVASGDRVRVEKEKNKDADSFNDLIAIPENIEDFIDMTLRDIITMFGTDARFVDFLKATKTIEDINEKRLKNAQIQGGLVSREIVKKTIIDPVDEMLRKLLTDGAKTITLRVLAMHDAGRDLLDKEQFVKDQMSSFIRPMKDRVLRGFRKIEGE